MLSQYFGVMVKLVLERLLSIQKEQVQETTRQGSQLRSSPPGGTFEVGLKNRLSAMPPPTRRTAGPRRRAAA